jgi:hypothetical protein
LFRFLDAFLKKGGVNKKGVNKKSYAHQKYGVSVIECSQPNGVKPKKRERKLKGGVNWGGSLKQKRVKQTGVKQGLGVVTVHW